ncbi:hypothetical protein N657DRAFT_471018 [Parathielavia appendiculata]|uniref:Secreted protein n=1 Tax=Parathielavia appendiculata TaxID=2587402 RepID=A0AAN6TXS9_9PEZI|nr:hypothetical protein N657DRAFT_471018 [Parathielavia appendiculata]
MPASMSAAFVAPLGPLIGLQAPVCSLLAAAQYASSSETGASCIEARRNSRAGLMGSGPRLIIRVGLLWPALARRSEWLAGRRKSCRFSMVRFLFPIGAYSARPTPVSWAYDARRSDLVSSSCELRQLAAGKAGLSLTHTRRRFVRKRMPIMPRTKRLVV